MKIIFLLPTGTIEWPIPENFREGFNFPFFCGNIRMTGFFQQDNIHLQYDKMVGMVLDNESTPAPTMHTGQQSGTLQ